MTFALLVCLGLLICVGLLFIWFLECYLAVSFCFDCAYYCVLCDLLICLLCCFARYFGLLSVDGCCTCFAGLMFARGVFRFDMMLLVFLFVYGV